MKKNTETFDEYLVAQHAAQYHGTGDLMPDDYNDWRAGLDVEDVIEMAQRWGEVPSQVDVEAVKKEFDEKAYKHAPILNEDSTAKNPIPLGNFYWYWTPEDCWNFFAPYLTPKTDSREVKKKQWYHNSGFGVYALLHEGEMLDEALTGTEHK